MSSGSGFTTNTNVSYKEPSRVFQLLPPGLQAQLCVAREREERSSGRGGAGKTGGGRRRGGAPASPRSAMRGFLLRRPRAPHARTRGRPASALPGTGRGQGAETTGCTLRHARTAGLPGCHPPSPDPAP